jgi:hypothetical protein
VCVGWFTDDACAHQACSCTGAMQGAAAVVGRLASWGASSSSRRTRLIFFRCAASPLILNGTTSTTHEVDVQGSGFDDEYGVSDVCACVRAS